MMNKTSIAIGAALLTAGGIGCGGSDNSGPLGNVDSIVILQRASRNDTGNIFDYTSYIPGARLIKLSPPTAAGTVTVLCCDQDPTFAQADISGYDLSFDASEIAFTAKLNDNTNYGLFRLTLADGTIQQLATDPQRDYVGPVYLPDNKILFTTNAVVSNTTTDPNPEQHRDEYERGTTTQMGTINIDGTGEALGPRNLSHRSLPSLASDGRVIFTNWDHLGPENAGHLMFMQQDMTKLFEAFGKEGSGVSNSTLKAREIAPGRFIGIATDRDRTLQAGALIDIRLGFTSTDSDGNVSAATAMSEAHATSVVLTPDVPLDRTPSSMTVGRYYDAFPLDAKEQPQLLVSWADGPVESSTLAAAGVNANFGIYEFDSTTGQRHPIFDDPNMWDIFARPLEPRDPPPATNSQIDQTLGAATAEIGAMNVYDSTLHTFDAGSVFGVRVMEGFSSEEGFPMMFGTTMFEGHAGLGISRVQADGSWLAKVPANVPLHLQAVDIYGMSLFNEPVWFSARPGETRVCGGCHEDRASTTVIQPGNTDAAQVGPIDAMSLVPRANRMMTAADIVNPNLIATDGTLNASYLPAGIEKLVGVSWGSADPTAGGTGAIQQIFNDHCVSCHDANNSAGVAPYTITNPMTGESVTWTFNLTAAPIPAALEALNTSPGMTPQAWSSSYYSVAGPDMEAIERNNLVISGNFKVYMNPEDAAHSILIQKVNPTQLFPAPTAQRAFTTQPHSAEVGYTELTPTEFYKLILAADMGLNYYARENDPGDTDY
ncbi:MAG TPA: hypothetical protein VMJ10_20045 [Kofleriaceae bacterium]|nr:hypothetical protein [Kofleriaceae bacterium]